MCKEKEANGALESALRRLYIGFRRNGKQMETTTMGYCIYRDYYKNPYGWRNI